MSKKAFILSEQPAATGELAGLAASIGYSAAAIVFSQEEAAQIVKSGVSRILVVSGASQRPEAYTKCIAQLLQAEECSLLLAVGAPRTRELAAGITGFLGIPLVNDAMDISCSEDAVVTKRMLYGGSTVSTECYKKGVGVILPAGKYEPAAAGEDAAIELVEAAADERVVRESVQPIVQEGEGNILEAERVIGIGLGLGSADGLPKVKELAALIDAELGCTRPVAEEKHWLDHSRYIGISNLNLNPKLYLGLGVSGQVQHIVGVKEAKVIAGVNTDENATIFRSCDYGIVGDMYEFIEEMKKALGE